MALPVTGEPEQLIPVRYRFGGGWCGIAADGVEQGTRNSS